MSGGEAGRLAGVPVLVTGATGFIGSRLARRLVRDEGARVVGTGRDVEKVAWLGELGVELVAADLRDGEALLELVRGKELVFHAAAALGTDAATAQRVNVEATEALARVSHREGVDRFVLVSTVGVYDMAGRPSVDETTPLALDHPAAYPRTKARAEERLFRVAGGTRLEAVAVRPSMVYGPGPGLWTLGMYRSVCNGDPVYVGDGSYGFNPVYLDDVVEALVRCAVAPRAAGEAFNVSAGVTTWRDFMGRYGEACGKEAKGLPLWLARLMAFANRIPGVRTPVDRGFIEMATSRKTFPVDKARELLGWEPTTDLDEGMARTLAWLQEVEGD